MKISKSTKSYINTSQKVRTIIRQMISGGYCVVISEDSLCFSFVKSILKANGIETNLANFTYSASLLKEDAHHVISIIVDIDKHSYLKAVHTIEMIEKQYPEIPYIVFTGDSYVASWISDRYPKLNILIKDDNMIDLIDALGVSDCA